MVLLLLHVAVFVAAVAVAVYSKAKSHKGFLND